MSLQPGLFALLVWALVFAPTARAVAQNPEATAEALFRAGREAASQADYALACPRFRESQRLAPAPGTLLNLAICEDHLGQLVEAWQHYHAALESLTPDDRRLRLARDNLANLDRRLPRFVIRPPAQAPADLRVYLGALEITASTFGVSIPINPGTHTWIAEAARHRRRTLVRQVREGQRIVLDVALEPLSRPKLHVQPATEKERALSGPRIAAYSLLGLGAASLAVGSVTGVMMLHEQGTVDEECPNLECSDKGWKAAKRGHKLALVSTISFGFGIVAVGSGAFLYFSRDVQSGAPMLRAKAAF